jgi:hypothetical protein
VVNSLLTGQKQLSSLHLQASLSLLSFPLNCNHLSQSQRNRFGLVTGENRKNIDAICALHHNSTGCMTREESAHSNACNTVLSHLTMSGLLVCVGAWAGRCTGKGAMLYLSTTAMGDLCIGAASALQAQARRLPSISRGPAVCFSDLSFCPKTPDPVTSTAFPPFLQKMRYCCTQCDSRMGSQRLSQRGRSWTGLCIIILLCIVLLHY